MSNPKALLGLFEGFGVELEYMIVHRNKLTVQPIADQLIYDEVGEYLSDVEFGEIAWSNELVLHVIELKTQGPVKSLAGLHLKMQEHVRKINKMLEKYDAMLLPTGAHPFMNPETDTKLWPHEYNAIYEAYNKVFDCRGHGWANLQSTHLNLPFANDDEFGKLHAAIRVLLPIIPALSASSPILDGKQTGLCDARLEVYRHNQDRIPQIAGKVIPEQAFTKKEYKDKIFAPIYKAIAPYDKEGILQDEFLNSRGAIARFQRNAIEIRLIDIQESPAADIAVLQAIVAALQALVSGRWVKVDVLKTWHEDRLAPLLLDVISKGQQAIIKDPEYVSLFGYRCDESCTVGELWKHLIKDSLHLDDQPEIAYILNIILSRGNLSRRIIEATGENPSKERITQVYKNISDCLQHGGVFLPEKQC